MRSLLAILIAVMLLGFPLGAVIAGNAQPAVPAYTGYPTFAIASVQKGVNVTIVPSNFPPNDTFQVRMNWMGTKGVAGQIVATITTDASGNLSSKTFNIPSFLQNATQIAIRLESSTSGYFAYNWFWNTSTSGGGGGTSSSSSYVGYPTFAISAVTRNVNVTIVPSNFPPNDTFWVRLNWMGTQGIAGEIVQTVTTDASGNLNDTIYPIPSWLNNATQIAIRLESPTSGYYAYNWFWNNTTP